ncbi:PE-PPE domain-containing protein, partial [Gordonia sp. UBA5067]
MATETPIASPAGPVKKRGWPRIVALAGIVGGVALCAALLTPPGGAHAECSGNGAVVIVPGTNDPTGEGSMKGVIETAKGQGKDVIVVGYPTTLWPAGSVGYNKDVALGKAATSKAISDYQSKCAINADDAADKTGHVQVVGYSQGARVAGDVLGDIGQGKAGAPSAVGVTGVLYSDPRQEGPESARGIERSFLGVVPGLTMSGSRGGFGVLSNDVVSVCSQGDPICGLPDPIHDPLGALDGLVGYFVKHGDYPQFGAWGRSTDGSWYWDDPVNWAGGQGNCVQATNGGGLVCTKPQDSSISRVIRDVATGLGMSAADAANIPDLYGQVNKVLNINTILPHANLNDLQPVVDLVYNALPKLPYLTSNAGGYLPDALTFGNLIGGIAQVLGGGNGSVLRQSASAIGRSVVSILLVPVNGALYWGNTLLGTPYPAAIKALGFIPDETKDWSLPPFWADSSGPPGWGTPNLLATQAGPAATAPVSRAAFTASLKAAEGTSVWTAAQRDAARPDVSTGPASADQRTVLADSTVKSTSTTPSSPDATEAHGADGADKPAPVPAQQSRTSPSPEGAGPMNQGLRNPLGAQQHTPPAQEQQYT